MQSVTNTSQTTTTTANSANEVSSAAGSDDFQTFLTLLTAQMRNQDPLKPLESTEFVAQLATFSSVEQQVQTNEKLSQLIGLFAVQDSAVGLADWIGKEVGHIGYGEYTGSPVEVGLSAPAEASESYLLVRDADDQIVYRQQFDPSEDTIIWNGELTGSGTAASGYYSFEVESYSEGALIDVSAAYQFGLVTEVRAEADGVHLLFSDGYNMLAEDATAIRLPS